jgi:glycosyltransferase involved in cell wall biosynthesis
MTQRDAGAARPAASLVIAAYNRPDFLEKIFLALRNQTLADFEIVVADDGSGPAVAETIARYNGGFARPIVHVWHEDDGFRKTVIANKAVLAASSDYLAFIDGDCVPHHRFLERHVRHRCRGVVCAGRRLMLDAELTAKVTDEDVSSRRIERPGFWWRHCAPGERKHGIYVPLVMHAENLFKRRYSFYGSNFSLYKDDFLAVNGYDERILGRGHEDDNLRERLRLSGARVRSVTREALQYHLHHSFDPVPHASDAVREFCFPARAWTPYGIEKKEKGRP